MTTEHHTVHCKFVFRVLTCSVYYNFLAESDVMSDQVLLWPTVIIHTAHVHTMYMYFYQLGKY